MDRRIDAAVAFCVVLLGIFVLVAAQDVRPASIADPIGSKGAPRFVGIVLLLGGVSLVLRRLLRWRSEPTLVPAEGTEDDRGVAPGSAVRALSIWLAAVIYVQALPGIGYVLATPLFLGVVLWLFAIRSWLLVAVPLGFTIPVFLVFTLFLNVRLPTGVLDDVLRQWGLV
jgi:putative tricarboxylic transport membrane protein